MHSTQPLTVLSVPFHLSTYKQWHLLETLLYFPDFFHTQYHPTIIPIHPMENHFFESVLQTKQPFPPYFFLLLFFFQRPQIPAVPTTQIVLLWNYENPDFAPALFLRILPMQKRKNIHYVLL